MYVDEGTCERGARACFVRVTASKSQRFMWVKVDTKKADWNLMGSIGHELRHTLEVIAEPFVRSDAAKFNFYERIGRHVAGGGQETQAATDTGNTVRSEVRKFNRVAKSQ